MPFKYISTEVGMTMRKVNEGICKKKCSFCTSAIESPLCKNMSHFRFWGEMGHPSSHSQCNSIYLGSSKVNGSRNENKRWRLGGQRIEEKGVQTRCKVKPPMTSRIRVVAQSQERKTL